MIIIDYDDDVKNVNEISIKIPDFSSAKIYLNI